jgi:hypothetical protein
MNFLLLTVKNKLVTKPNMKPRNWTDSLDKRPLSRNIFRKTDSALHSVSAINYIRYFNRICHKKCYLFESAVSSSGIIWKTMCPLFAEIGKWTKGKLTQIKKSKYAVNTGVHNFIAESLKFKKHCLKQCHCKRTVLSWQTFPGRQVRGDWTRERSCKYNTETSSL